MMIPQQRNRLEFQVEESQPVENSTEKSGNAIASVVIGIIVFILVARGIGMLGSSRPNSRSSLDQLPPPKYDYVPNYNSHDSTKSSYLNNREYSTEFYWIDKGGKCDTDACRQSANYILGWMNQDMNPCDDFYEYACGNWPKFIKTPINANSSMNNFDKLNEAVEYVLHETLTQPVNKRKIRSDEIQDIKISYQTCIGNGEDVFEALVKNLTDTETTSTFDINNINVKIDELIPIRFREMVNFTQFRSELLNILNSKQQLSTLSNDDGYNRTMVAICLLVSRLVHGKRPLEKIYVEAINFNKNNTKRVTEMLGMVQSALTGLYKNSSEKSDWKTGGFAARDSVYSNLLKSFETIKGLRIIKACIGPSPNLNNAYATLKDNIEYLTLVEKVIQSNKSILIIPKCFWVTPTYQPKAIYNPFGHSIEVTAAMLQPPFLDTHRPIAMNYGSVGFILGHELGHSIASEYFTDLKNLGPAPRCIKNQYGIFFTTIKETIEIRNVTIRPGILHVNSSLTFVENFSDSVGLSAAYKALSNLLASPRFVKMEIPGLERFTPEQQFFLGYAQTWCSISSPQGLAYQIKTDSHAPERFRVLGTLRNSYEFAKTWKCPANSNMNPVAKCILL